MNRDLDTEFPNRNSEQDDAELKNIDDAKTVEGHCTLILKYRRTGKVDRDEALEKYREFNLHHPDYVQHMVTHALGKPIDLAQAPPDVLITNLQAQLDYLLMKKTIGVK